MFVVGLALEPLTFDLASQLGAEVRDHCFTSEKQIREAVSSLEVALTIGEQRVAASMAEYREVHCTLKNVRVRKVSIAKREASEAGAEAKSRKVAPQAATWRATFEALVDAGAQEVRDFLAANIHKTLFYTFDDEQQDLYSRLPAEDGGTAQQTFPPEDAEAGDVLDAGAGDGAGEAPARKPKPKRGAKPTLVKGARTNSKGE